MGIEEKTTDNNGQYIQRDMKCLGFNEDFNLLWENSRFISSALVGEEAKYLILDDELYGEIWIELENEEIPDDYDYLLYYRSGNYNSFILQNWVEDKDSIKSSFSRLVMNNSWAVPLNVLITNARLLENVELGSEVLCSITCFPAKQQVKFYKNEEDCIKGNDGLAAVGIIPIGTFTINDDSDFKESAYAMISGKVRNFNIRTNFLTSARYVHFTIKSLDVDFDVVVPLEEVPYPLDEIKYIFGVFYMNGYIKTANYQRYSEGAKEDSYLDTLNENEFKNNIEVFLETMRSMLNEYYIADFGEMKNFPVKYIQTVINDDCSLETLDTHTEKNYRIEYAKKDAKGNERLFKLKTENDFCDLNLAVKIFHTVCVEGKEPLDWEWEDISYLIKQ